MAEECEYIHRDDLRKLIAEHSIDKFVSQLINFETMLLFQRKHGYDYYDNFIYNILSKRTYTHT